MSLTEQIHGFATANPWMTGPVIVVTAVALFGGGVLFLTACLRRRDGTRLFLAGGIGLALVIAACYAITGAHYVDRPFVVLHFQPLFPHAANASFPSSLTAMIAVAAGVALPASRRLAAVLTLATVVVAAGCVYVGVHWVSDVVVGAALGIAAGLVGWGSGGLPDVRSVIDAVDARLRP